LDGLRRTQTGLKRRVRTPAGAGDCFGEWALLGDKRAGAEYGLPVDYVAADVCEVCVRVCACVCVSVLGCESVGCAS
jgi:hypothetical protein